MLKVIIEGTPKEVTDLLYMLQSKQENKKITFFEFDRIQKNMKKADEYVKKQVMDKINEAIGRSDKVKTYIITLSDCFGTKRKAMVKARSKTEACYNVHANDGEFVTECCELD